MAKLYTVTRFSISIGLYSFCAFFDNRRLATGPVDDLFGRTPLLWVAENGHKVIVKLLLETGIANVEARDNTFYQTPLSWATGKGHEAIVKLLLETGGVNVEAAFMGRRERTRGYRQAAARDGQSRCRFDGHQWSDATFMGRRERT